MQPIDNIKLPSDQSPPGVYQVPAGYLQSQTHQSVPENMQWHFFPRLDTVIRESLLNALSETLGFPDYFGHNWDAAWDCLSEQVWPLGQRQIIYLHIEADAFLAENDLHTFVELMNDACQHWASKNMACHVLIETDRHDSKTLSELRLPGKS